MKKVIQLAAIGKEGRFCNWLVHYIVGKNYAYSMGATIEIPRGWIGEELFEISEFYIQKKADGRIVAELPPFFDLPHRIVDPCLTRSNVKRLLRWRPGCVIDRKPAKLAVHVRRGDFLTDRGFPIVSEEELKEQIEAVGFNIRDCQWVKERPPYRGGPFIPPLSFLEDFQTLMLAENVFVYPRSTFSQMAALLGDGNIWMPYDYFPGITSCKFRKVDPEKPVIFPTKNNSL